MKTTMQTTINGRPIAPLEAVSRRKGYADKIEFFRDRPDQIGQMNVVSVIKDGLFGGVHPSQIAADLKTIGIDSERAKRLLGRTVSTFKFAFVE